ncbi:uncharacterized protein K444DRAFT_646623 [Hyaloscypha bicolor E]|uniref:DUF1996 domain-containing protein n=1 Tax=Hyaloscypha bicolor E TaxID=1095630 RepID=A0A2J6SSE2_9HELO|nr:uncharacterized protein K444DRAFT_646623 [Hyaloscypha bicolor E]PMD53694.1 hypothetical protein K444DRAFT_646623 [Hyaloscypha bicolor E]
MVLDAPSGNATMLLSCSQLVTERLDPYAIPPPHHSTSLHHVHFIEDISNYWTAVLYFKARNGTFKRVPQKGNVRFESANGGGQTLFHTAYGGSGKVNVTAFNPVGFFSPKFRRPAYTGLKRASTRSGEILYFPNTAYAVGIVANARFPTCRDGVNYDSADQQSHAAYPQSGTFENGGPCPSTHPVHIPQLFYETAWVTTKFNDKLLWPTDGSQPFGNSMQRAMNANCDVSCPSLKTQTIAQANKCLKSMNVKEDVDSC